MKETQQRRPELLHAINPLFKGGWHVVFNTNLKDSSEGKTRAQVVIDNGVKFNPKIRENVYHLEIYAVQKKTPNGWFFVSTKKRIVIKRESELTRAS